ncbi:MAG: energy-dependent translational throttle protein EttA [Holosporaceae bacterium]
MRCKRSNLRKQALSYQYIYVMKNLMKGLPQGRTLFKDITLSFLPGAKIGVVGVNGTGKSTLLKVMAGLDTDFSGEAFAADGVRVGYLPQEPQLDPKLTVGEHIENAFKEIKELRAAFDAVSARFADPLSDDEMQKLLEEQAALQEKIDAQDGWDLERRVQMASEALRCPAPDTQVQTLSGGEKRRVALCKLLLEAPDILLLDEPTNHLDAESVAWLQRFLQDYKGTVILVTHDRYFLDQVVEWILELDRGTGIPFKGNYSVWLEAKQKRLQHEAASEAQRQKTLSRELDWIRANPKGRQTKNKARTKAYEELLANARKGTEGSHQIMIPTPSRLGDTVLEVTNLQKAFQNKLLFENLSFTLPRGALVGIVGANGAGKTTLFRLLMELEAPQSGAIKVGDTVAMGYVDQSRANLKDDATVWEEIAEGQDLVELGHKTMQSRAYVSQFGFKGPDQQKKVGALSGGERNRLHLAKLLKKGANLLLLDEPTNDLDIDTLRALEDALLDYAGCAMIISHDRWFLDRLATHLLAFEGDGRVVWFEGNYADYEEDKKRRLGDAAVKPFRYKPLAC